MSEEGMMKIFQAFKSFVPVALLLAGMDIAAAQEKWNVRIGMSSSSVPAATARLAKEMGLFEKHGVDAKVTPMDNGTVATTALISGSVDFVTTGVSDLFASRSRGQDIVALTSAYRGFAAVVVLSKAAAERTKLAPDAPARERFKALDGLAIAGPSASSTFTQAVKISAEELGAKVRFTYMSQPAMIAALETGAIDGFIASSPYHVTPVIRGNAVLWINGPKGDFPPDNVPVNSTVVITKGGYARENPALVKAVKAAFADLSTAFEAEPAAVKAALQRVYPEITGKTLDLVFETDLPGFRTTPLTVEELAHDLAFTKKGGVSLPQEDRLDPNAVLLR
jgi:ABC-type nitrate/sulfonate/bicarbonate transport system substrate-binding protein